MLVKDLKQVWVSEYEKINDHGENTKKWKFKALETKTKTAFLNIQEELDKAYEKTAGNVDYVIRKGITTANYNINKGDGISFSDISAQKDFKPEYIVTDCPKIGNATIYKMEKYNGD